MKVTQMTRITKLRLDATKFHKTISGNGVKNFL